MHIQLKKYPDSKKDAKQKCLLGLLIHSPRGPVTLPAFTTVISWGVVCILRSWPASLAQRVSSGERVSHPFSHPACLLCRWRRPRSPTTAPKLKWCAAESTHHLGRPEGVAAVWMSSSSHGWGVPFHSPVRHLYSSTGERVCSDLLSMFWVVRFLVFEF